MKSGLLVAILLFAALTPAHALLAGFSHRAPINITAGANVTDYTAHINLTFAAAMQNDFDDIRFAYENDTKLPYWIENKTDGAYAFIHFKGNWDTFNNTQVFVYYGNAGATSESLGNNTFTLWDDFLGSSFSGDWTTTGNPTVSGSEAHIDQNDRIFHTDTFAAGFAFGMRWRSNAQDIKPHQLGSTDVVDPPREISILNSQATDPGNFSFLRLRSNDGSSTTTNVDIIPDFENNHIITEIKRLSGNLDFVVDHISILNKTTNVPSEALHYQSVGFGGASIHSVDWVYVRKFIDPEPVALIGAEEVVEAALSFSFDPASPHIEETVNFNASITGSLNVSIYFWDFNDSTPIVQTASNQTSHVFNLGGAYNVSLVATNQSGANFTANNVVTVFEPLIAILAQNTASQTLVPNFTVTAENATVAFNFTADGTQALWNYTEGPSGLVNLSIIAAGFNHTTEQVNITNSSNVNFTTSLFPAVVQIWRVTNYEFTNVRGIPADVEISNATAQLTFTPVEEFTFNVTYQGSGVTGESNIGSIWRWVYDVITPGSLVTLIELCDEDEDNCISVSNLTNTDDERYLMLEPDGTYKIRTTGGSITSSGSFAFFPGTLTMQTTGDPPDVANFKFFEMRIPYVGCTINNGCPIGNVSARITQTTAGIYGFVGTTYQPLWLSFTDVTANDVRNKTAFMINNANAFGVKFVVIDDARSFVSDAEVIVFRSINGTLQELTSALTDLSGEVPTSFLEKNTEIIVIASRGGRTTGLVTKFITENRIVNPIFLSLQLLAFEVLPVAFNTTSIIVTPPEGTTLRENTTVQFNVSIFNSEGTLTNSTVWLNSTGLNFSFFQSSASGSGLLFLQNVSIPIVNTTSNRINLFYSVTDENSGTFSKTITYVVFPETGLATLEDDVVPFLGPFQHLVSLLVLAGAYSISITLGAFISLGLFIAGMTTLEVALLSATTVFFLRQQEVKR